MTIKKLQTADVALDSEGLVAITTVEELCWVYQQTSAQAEDFYFNEALWRESLGGENA
jgi:hypothetical protein